MASEPRTEGAQRAGEEREQVITFEGGELTLGRSNSNDVVLDDVNVSRFHATIVPRANELELRDLDSRCGTRLNGRAIKRAVIEDGSVIGIGPYRLRFDGSRFTSRNERGTLRLDADGVSVVREGTRILEPVSLKVGPGELVAVIGESGSGKTTLMRSLAGIDRPTEGRVTLNGEPVTARLTDVGYVPQDEIVHPLLSVDEALHYAARLRLSDADDLETRSTVDRVLAELALEPHRDTRIGSLSGGQRKRVGVGSELLNRPSMLFLDEPTTGLDPGLESQLMELFRYLARPGARAVVLVTHATRNLTLCDKLVVLGRGGTLCFEGSPSEALEFFDVEDYDEIYTALGRRPAAEWRRRLEQRRGERVGPGPAGDAAPEPGPAGSARAKHSAISQLRVLVSRYLHLFVRDRRNALILFGQVPIIALAIAFLFQTGLFELPGRAPDGSPALGRPRDAIQALFLLVTTAIWFGSISASREIVKERPVVEREAAIGVRWSAYLSSKAIVLFGVAGVQTVALAYFVFAIHPLRATPSVYLAVTAILVLASWVAVGMGLLISASVSTQDQATSFIPLALIPQLLFAGAVVPVERMTAAIEALTHVIFARWALAGSGTALDMQERIEADTAFRRAGGFGDTFFTVATGRTLGILLAFLIVFFAVTAQVVASRSSRR